MRISDWSSDVCSSDLGTAPPRPGSGAVRLRGDPGTCLVRSAWKRRRIVPNRIDWRQTLSPPAHPAPSQGELPMSRLPLVDPAATTADRMPALDKIHDAFCAPPTILKTIGRASVRGRLYRYGETREVPATIK